MQRIYSLIQDKIVSPMVVILASLLGTYCLFHYRMGGLTHNHLLLAAAILFLFFAHRQTRQFLLLASPLILKDILYDALRYIPFDWMTPIHIGDLYRMEGSLFGMTCAGEPRLINECLALWAHPTLDVVCGFFYHLLNPFVFLIFVALWKIRGEEVTSRYAIGFLVMNLMAFATYILYPAAAPWYVEQHGFDQPIGPVVGQAAGLIHFDQIIGSNFSTRLYSQNPVVFGAVPSMHAGFTMFGSLYAFRIGKIFGSFIFFYAMTMWFSALYLQHHYLIDIVWGVGYALAAYGLVEFWLKDPVSQFFVRLSSLIRQQEASPLIEPSYSGVADEDKS